MPRGGGEDGFVHSLMGVIIPSLAVCLCPTGCERVTIQLSARQSIT